MERLYLVRLWKHSKGLFLFIAALIALQFFFNWKRMNCFPFINWDMYARPAPLPGSVSRYFIYLDGEALDLSRLPSWKEETALNSFRLYKAIRDNYGHDPMDELVQHRTAPFPPFVYRFTARQIGNEAENVAAYPDWLFNYLRRATNTYFHKLEVRELNFYYTNGQYQTDGKAHTHLVVQHD